MNSNELISVIIPVSNRAIELKRCLESAVSQVYRNIEVIVVANNTNNIEPLEEVVSSFKDDRIQLNHLTQCDNANVARNYGMRTATGNYLAFLDSDDEWLPNHLSLALDLMRSRKLDFVYGSFFVWDGVEKQNRNARDLFKGEDPFEYIFGKQGGWAPTPSFFMRKTVGENIIWDESLKRHQDFDFFVRVVSHYASAAKLTYDIKVNWVKGERRIYDFDSMRYFYNKWKNKMPYATRRSYLYGKTKEAIRGKKPYSCTYFLFTLLGALVFSRSGREKLNHGSD